MLTDLEAREALHVLLLSKLSEELRPDAFALKGGLNLRLFFGSPRYSDDMDLDIDPRAKDAIVRAITALLASRWLAGRLESLAIARVDFGGRPAKRTDTTLRFKLAVINHGGIRLPTRIEASLRDRSVGDAVSSEAPAQAVIERYRSAGVESFVIPHYPRDPMIRQKIRALAGRSVIQARDVFDLHVLAEGNVRNADITFLRRALPPGELTEASDRALRITYRQFKDQVSEFLPDADRAALDEASWEERQVFVVDLIGAILGH
jgi:hypothetical protein